MPAGHGLGIKTGEVWAYRESSKLPVRPARIVDPGRHYGSDIEIFVLTRPQTERLWVKRVKLPCKWDEINDYIARRREPWTVDESAVVTEEPTHWPEPSRPSIQKVSVPIAYNIVGAAAAVGYSPATIRREIQRGNINPRYANSKAIITHTELLAWVESLPYDKP